MRFKSVLFLIVAGLLAAGVIYLSTRHRRPPNVILIVLDTLRADHVGVYGYDRATTPHLDAFARSSLLFKNAYTSAPWTPPAIGSMFTGLYASAHGMMPPNGRGLARKESAMLDASNVTLAEILKERGYQTGGVTPNPWIKAEFGYDQGFDNYYYRDRAAADEITRAGIKVVDAFKDEQPFFLFLHYLDPHDPYNPPEKYRTAFDAPLKNRNYAYDVIEKINLYDGEILFMDEMLGKFFEHLKSKGVWDNTTILVLGDHGEQFMEHGHQGHGFMLYNEELHVPFILKHGSETGTREEVVSNVDVLPTLLAAAGLEIPGNSQGLSLLDRASVKNRSGTLSEIDRKYDWKSFNSADGMRLILDYGKITDPSNPQPEFFKLFNSFTDGGGEAPLQDEQLAKELRLEFDSLYQSALDRKIVSKPKEISEGTIEELRSLGYLK